MAIGATAKAAMRLGATPENVRKYVVAIRCVLRSTSFIVDRAAT